MSVHTVSLYSSQFTLVLKKKKKKVAELKILCICVEDEEKEKILFILDAYMIL